MRHELLTQRALFCIGVNAKKGTLSQHFVTRVVPPWARGVIAPQDLTKFPTINTIPPPPPPPDPNQIALTMTVQSR